MESKAQISFEYLLVLMFAVLLVVAAAALALNLTVLAQAARTKIVYYRDETIASLMG